MRRMLDPTKVGGLPSTIQFDEAGNRTASKDVKVDGKLKLESLVSSTNPDGDITKELGGSGGELYWHCILINGRISTSYYNKSKTPFTFTTFRNILPDNKKKLPCSGVAKRNDQYYTAISRYAYSGSIVIDCYNTSTNSFQAEQISANSTTDFIDNVIIVI